MQIPYSGILLLIYGAVLTGTVVLIGIFIIPILKELRENLNKVGRIIDMVEEEGRPTLKSIAKTTDNVNKLSESVYQKFENTTKALGILKVVGDLSKAFQHDKKSRSLLIKILNFVLSIMRFLTRFLTGIGTTKKNKGGEKIDG